MQVANEIRATLSTYRKTLPAIVEIPSKDKPYVRAVSIAVPMLGTQL